MITGLAVLPTPPAEAATAPSAVAASVTAARSYFFSNWVPTLQVPVGWTGNASGCVAGSISPQANNAILGAVNYMRTVAGVPPLTQDATLTTNAQAAALMLQATGYPYPGGTPHVRTTDGWLCSTPEGIADGGVENVAYSSAPFTSDAATPLSGLMGDRGVPNLGHRSNILLSIGTSAGIGEATNMFVLKVGYNWDLAISNDYAWPAAGYTPYEVASISTNNTWAFYPNSGDASAANVTVLKNGQPLSGVQLVGGVWNAAQGSQNTAVSWTMPTLARPAIGGVDDYTVTVSGITGRAETSVIYHVYIFNAAEASVGSVVIDGTAQVGQTLTAAVTGVSPAGATLAYQWLRNGAAISGATASTYLVATTDASTNLTVAATATYSQGGVTYAPASATSAPVVPTPQPAVTIGTVTITGTAQVGQTLTAAVTGVSPAGATLAYQWLRNGAAITGATASIYLVATADASTNLTVTVTATYPGYITASTTSAPVYPVTEPLLESSIGFIAISGTAQVGQTLTAVVLDVSPAGATITYKWLRNGAAITGATASTYKVVTADVGTSLQLSVTATYPGYYSAYACSEPVIPVAASQPAVSIGSVTITGTAEVGRTLTATVTGLSPAGATLTYQWYWGGVIISGATSSTYLVTMADVDTILLVRVTATYLNYGTAYGTSEPVVPVAAPQSVVRIGSVVISGTAQVGQTLTATASGVSPTGATLTYKWLRNGAAISGANSRTYTVAAADAGTSLTVTVTGTYPNYAPASKTSAARPIPAAPKTQFTLTFNPQGGTVSPTSKTITVGKEYGSLPTPIRAGYTFKGWYTTPSGGTKITSTTKLTTPNNVTAYAHWAAKKFTTKFNPNGGATPKTSGKVTTSKSVTMGNAYGKLPTTTKKGYTFAGWYTAKSGGTKITSTSPFSAAKNQTLYAHWNAKLFTVKLKPQKGTVTPTSIRVTYNSTYKILPTPTRPGYTFLGWYTKASGGIKIKNSTKVTILKTQTLYAHWKKLAGN